MDNLEDLEDLTSLWTFDQSIEDVRRQLKGVTKELVEARKAAIEQRKTHKENVQKVLQLLGIAFKERDQARDQFHKLMIMKPHHDLPNSTMMTTSILSPQTPMISISRLSDQSNVLVSSADNLSSCSSTYDRGSAIIDNLAKGRPRPEKGKLLESVLKAGPLLNTLLVAGLLPEWRDPPPVSEAPQVPPVPINEYKVHARIQAQSRARIMGVTSTNLLDTPCISSTTKMLNFDGDSCGSFRNPSASGRFHHQIAMRKRQRIQ